MSNQGSGGQKRSTDLLVLPGEHPLHTCPADGDGFAG